MSRADPETAANDLLRALAASPNDPELTLQAFIAAVSSGRPEAVTLARRLPDSQVAQLLLAGGDAKAGRWKRVEQRFHAMPRQGLVQILQPLLVAWSQQGDGRTEEALTTLRPFMDTPRFKGLFALHSAMIADVGNRREDAARYYQMARTELADVGVRTAQILASWQARSGQPGEAQRTLSELAAAAPDSGIALPALVAGTTTRPVASATDGIAESYVTLAAALRSQNAGEFALIMLQLALDLRPNLTAARLMASEIRAQQRHPEAALRVLSSVQSNDPVYGIVRLRRAALAERLGRTDEAFRELQQIARDFPNSPAPELQLGDLYRIKSRFAEAIGAYDRAISRVPHPAANDWVLFYHRGIAFERSNLWQKAEADFHRALELSPDQPLVLNYLGYSWADKGQNLERARDMIQKAAARRPNDGAITDSLGWVLFRMGRIAEAVKLLERAVELEPEDPTINGHLGDAYWAAGRKVEAQYQWRRALTLNPPPDDVAKLEAKLNPPQGGSVVSGP